MRSHSFLAIDSCRERALCASGNLMTHSGCDSTSGMPSSFEAKVHDRLEVEYLLKASRAVQTIVVNAPVIGAVASGLRIVNRSAPCSNS
jgi:hypothetical protein